MAGFLGYLKAAFGAPAERRMAMPMGLSWLPSGSPQWTPGDPVKRVAAAWRSNPVAYRCLRLVSETVAAVPLRLRASGTPLQAHPLINLMARPNPMTGGLLFRDRLVLHLLTDGNAFVERLDDDTGQPVELHLLRPDRVSLKFAEDGWLSGYLVRQHRGATRLVPVDRVSGSGQILHLALSDPIDDDRGQPPLLAAMTAVDVHSAAARWNKALLDNAARPSGALVFEPRDGQPGHLSAEQVTRLRLQMEEQFQGSANAGRPFLLEGGLRWQPLSFSPTDMDFIATKDAAARDIALALGVPPLMLGLPGDNTYANYAEANRAFWRLTVIPLAQRLIADMGPWLIGPAAEEDLVLEVDLDGVPALADERRAAWDRVGSADFLSDADKKRLLGLADGND